MRTGTEIEIELVLIRHGATRSNKEHRYLGKTDESLSEEGKRSVRKMRMEDKYPECDLVFSSPLARCVETAQIIYPKSVARRIFKWKEIDFGRFEGKTYQELSADEEYQRWIDSDGTMPFPGGESREQFAERTSEGFREMLSVIENEMEEQRSIRAAAVVHGGTIMVLCSILKKCGYFEYRVKNGEGYICHLTYRDGNVELKELESL